MLAVVSSVASALESEPAATPHSTVRLVSPALGAKPGAPSPLGLAFTMKPGWHIYWRNPGESGEAPKPRWSLPSGYEAGPLEWPIPMRIRTKSVVSFGFDGTPLLGPTLHPASAASDSDRVKIALRLSYLACEDDSCVPATVNLALDVPMDAAPKEDARWTDAFASLRAAQPAPVVARVDEHGGDRLVLRVAEANLRAESELTHWDFFPRDPGVVDEAAEPAIAKVGDQIEIRLRRIVDSEAPTKGFGGLLVAESGGRRWTYELNPSPAVDPAPPSSQRDAATGNVGAPTIATSTPRIGAVAAIVFAFLGGLLLNLMPCVFPVLSLKVLSFVERAHGDPRGARSQGWAFAAGVLVSFWVLAGALLAVRAGGAELGWGFQLQSPTFIAFLAYLIYALALSLTGVFEVMTSLASGIAGRAESHDGFVGSFATGALATVVATPCTAPFMGPALGFALTQSPAMSMTVFTALGAGMAAPYVALAYFPRLLRALPKPGAWMDRFRQLMAFPLFATVLWLANVFERQTDVAALMRLLAGLLVFALALWIWGGGQHAARRSRAATAAAIVLAAIGFGVGLGTATSRTTADDGTRAHASDGFWQPWSPGRVDDLRSSGRGVFVNFTAAWCLSCKVNEGAIFARSDVRALFARYDVAPLEADWTNANSDITNTLASFGRDGVPLYVFYPAGLEGAPVLLPQVPTHQHLEAAFSGRG